MNRKKSRKPLVRIVVWLVAEIILNFTGIDDLADYSEFILEKRLLSHPVVVSEEYTDDTTINSSWLSCVYFFSAKLKGA